MSHDRGRRHSHDHIDKSIFTSEKGLSVVKWSFVAMLVTALLQALIVVYTHSVALLADTFHNFGHVITVIPLWIAFSLGRLRPSKRFSFGYGRVEDMAGVFIVFIMCGSGLVAGYEAIYRFFHPVSLEYIGVIIAASGIGFLGNELVARWRMKVGKEIGSAALVAEGYHARVDGWTSLAVLVGAVGVLLGVPMMDPLAGVVITMAIFWTAYSSGKPTFLHVFDGVEPGIIDDIHESAQQVTGVESLSEIRARWHGHQLLVEINISVDRDIPVSKGHVIGQSVREKLLEDIDHVGNIIVHVDPDDLPGEVHHNISASMKT